MSDWIALIPVARNHMTVRPTSMEGR
jgi:hypothetical protein